uniref:Uncharacterized protein n=1 Tax=Aegilops tauschii subsp. strangulata TaxID=200361 RepID=A0A453A3Y0_AEGTS
MHEVRKQKLKPELSRSDVVTLHIMRHPCVNLAFALIEDGEKCSMCERQLGLSW